MSEMVERVARAIYAAAEKEGGYVGTYRSYSYGDGVPAYTMLDGQFNLDAFARAAISAMLKPTEAMLAAGIDAG